MEVKKVIANIFKSVKGLKKKKKVKTKMLKKEARKEYIKKILCLEKEHLKKYGYRKMTPSELMKK